MPRPSRKRGLSKEQIPVLVARDRNGVTTDAVLSQLDRANVTRVLEGVVTSDNQLCCDGGKATFRTNDDETSTPGSLPLRASGNTSKWLAPQDRYRDPCRRWRLNQRRRQQLRWLNFRTGHGIATKYLGNYLGWRDTLAALRVDAEQRGWLLSAVGMQVCQRAKEIRAVEIDFDTALDQELRIDIGVKPRAPL